jgi:hydrogenase maturation protease
MRTPVKILAPKDCRGTDFSFGQRTWNDCSGRDMSGQFQQSMNQPRILIAGIGNVFFGDDAFGVEVLKRLSQHTLASHVRAIDFGIRGFDLACALLDGYESVILIDATSRGSEPGTLYVIEPDVEARAGDGCQSPMNGHSLDPAQVLKYASALGGPLPRIWLVGCEPAEFSADEPRVGLSEIVAEAVDRALPLVDSLIERLSSGSP